MASKRHTILYSGRVQGVGFRWNALQAMHGLAVTGYVRNLRDGRVELVIEGEEEATRAASERVRKTLGRLITDEQEATSPPTGEFSEMGVRR